MPTPQELAKQLKEDPDFYSVLENETPREKYSSITSEVNEEENLATMEQSEDFYNEYLFPAWLSYKNGQLQAPEMFAVSIANLSTVEYPFTQLKEDGLDTSEPITSHFRWTGKETATHLVSAMIRKFANNPTALLDEINNIWGF